MVSPKTVTELTSDTSGSVAVARLMVDGDDLVLRLAWWEKAIARRGDVRMPLAAVERTGIEPDWWRAVRGIRVRTRALVVPGMLCLGVWRHGGDQDFLALRRPRRAPTVVVDLHDLRTAAPYARVAVTCPHASQTVTALDTALDRHRRGGSSAASHHSLHGGLL